MPKIKKKDPNTMYVVCDANGECKGVFAVEAVANRVAEYYGAYVSPQVVNEILTTEVDEWIQIVESERK